MHRSHSSAAAVRGFTLVELLVVIAIIGVLMALLLPAVNGAREAGRRAACVTNQFQQAFAINRFNDSKRYIPGWRNWVSGTTGNAYAWPVVILPNMERKDVFSLVTASSAPSVYISFFVCPSSPPDALTNPVLHYVGSAGAGSNSVAGRASGVMVDVTATGTWAARVSMDDVAANDGTATTLLLSEECGPKVETPGAWNVAIAAGPTVNWSGSTPVFGLVSGSAAVKTINSGTFNTAFSSAANMPSSNHPGGAVVAFCDGHTGFLRDSLPGRVYAQLMSWNHLVASGTNPYATWTSGYPILQEGDYQ